MLQVTQKEQIATATAFYVDSCWLLFFLIEAFLALHV
jgi:hypothetical protein